MSDNKQQSIPEYSTPFTHPAGGWPEREELTLDDGYVTGVFHHRPPASGNLPPVLYLHGIQSHPGWFFGSAWRLAANGHDVFQVTRRGSGANRSDRGHARSAGQILDDVRRSVGFVLEQTGSQRLALVGVSWGGKLAAAYCARSDSTEQIASLTLIAPGIVSLVDVSIATKLGVAACLFARPRAQFAIPLNEPELFTDNETMKQFLRDDPLALHQATARFMYASRRLDRIVIRAASGRLKMPVTLILSADDCIIDSDATAKVIARLTEGQAEVISLNGRHTLEFEEYPSEFHQALLAACEK
ncbi:MAG: alpha/beta fold hydrolase [Phycisphaerae bacterium]|jgi:alpha-beta hydrolase superfamily lysophospholipase|nr:alpha/beta fold hydrolase [Phycisphaerae bacterium]